MNHFLKVILFSEDFHELYQGHQGEDEWPRKMAYVLIFLCLGKVVVDLRVMIVAAWSLKASNL